MIDDAVIGQSTGLSLGLILALVGVVVVPLIGVIGWAAVLRYRMAAIERKIRRHSARLKVLEDDKLARDAVERAKIGKRGPPTPAHQPAVTDEDTVYP